ncbi:MAG TPA: helix-turn-helix transcriptional regulator [Burkholderiaceae bacterium]|jgi:DNA-binding CsgD family transcriptional regulator
MNHALGAIAFDPALRSPRAHSLRPGLGLLERVLDEIDYGLLIVTATGRFRYANQLAVYELNGMGPLQLDKGRLVTSSTSDRDELSAALLNAARGRRSLLNLGSGAQALALAVVPLPDADDADAAVEAPALLVFNKRQGCVELTVDFYGRSKGLTATESTILIRLCQGIKPKEIARRQGVAISTVRSQIGSIRFKAQAASIHELVRRVAALPPFTPAVKLPPVLCSEPAPAPCDAPWTALHRACAAS